MFILIAIRVLIDTGVDIDIKKVAEFNDIDSCITLMYLLPDNVATYGCLNERDYQYVMEDFDRILEIYK